MLIDVGIGNGGVVGRVHDTGQRQPHNLYCSFIRQSANTAHSSARDATAVVNILCYMFSDIDLTLQALDSVTKAP